MVVLAGCANDSASGDGASTDDVTSARSFSLKCTGAEASLLAHDGVVDFTASQNGVAVLAATGKRPALSVRLEDGDSSDVHEYIELADAGLTVVPSVQPTTIEIGLDPTAKALSVKDTSTSLDVSCSFDRTALLAYLKIERVAAADMSGVTTVGFDVDDTLAFTTPAFLRGVGSGAVFGDDTFWTVVNSCDSGCPEEVLSLPDGTTHHLPQSPASNAKAKALELVQLHRSLGHKIYAITARPEIAGDAVRVFIEKQLGIAREDVFFEPASKTARMQSLGLDVYYGDADSDITDAAAVQGRTVKAYRFFRSPKSSNRSGTKLGKYHPGYFGEKIIADSYD